MRKPEFPKIIKSGSATVKIYRVPHKTAASGFAYTVAWHDVEGKPKRKQRADLDDAISFARDKASELGAGRVDAAQFSADDRQELVAARQTVAPTNTPVVTALREWVAAHALAPGQILAACREWAEKHRGVGFTPILVREAIETFIASKESAGKQGELTYRAKLKPVAVRFGDRHLHGITVHEWTLYLGTFADEVTRNDHRKRASALCHWARRSGHLPRSAPLAIGDTERAQEKPTEIGILTPEVFAELLLYFRDNHPIYLAPLVIAGFTGMRSDEIHGKRQDREVRQLWSDIHVDQKLVRVTNAKTNTPAWRFVPLCEAAIEWLGLCPMRIDKTVCEPAGMEQVRRIAIAAGFELPENCFRHSFITYRIAETENKPKVAGEAGNSVKEIDKRYRVPMQKPRGELWFSLTPQKCEELLMAA